ncbi:MAG TPA: SHOCT domain-containing protein [Actinomycetota bacterium]|nr:SHOCT domain-containing protein [Actinomycetota bacterium]
MGMMRRRARRRTALLVGGAAYEAGKHRNRQEEQAPPQEDYSPVPPAPAPSQSGPDLDELQKLGELHESGVLTDEEFATAKAKILGQ